MYVNGSKFEGEYFNDLKHGFGKYVLKNKEIYEGEFKKGKKCGQGFYQFKNGD